MLNCPKDSLELGAIEQLNTLPEHMVILDPFLNTVLPAKYFLKVQEKYLNTLKFNQITIIQNLHDSPCDIFEIIKKNILLLRNKASEEGCKAKFDPRFLKPCYETSLVHALNSHSGLKFDCGHDDYLVDAYTPMQDEASLAQARAIQTKLGHGKIRYHQEQRFFVLKHINKGPIAEAINTAYRKPRI